MKNRPFLIALVSCMLLVIPYATALAADYAVWGTLKTSSGANSGCDEVVKRVKVDMYDEDYGPDDYLGTEYTSTNGVFQVNFSMSLEDPDVYINVTYQFQAPGILGILGILGTPNIIIDLPGGTCYGKSGDTVRNFQG